jgi:hypothetical protein
MGYKSDGWRGVTLCGQTTKGRGDDSLGGWREELQLTQSKG